MSQHTQRKLAAIVLADVVGFSRLMGDDETGTLETLLSHKAELIEPKILGHGGRIVKTMGDGLLLEFPSDVQAVQCSVEIQNGMNERNLDVPIDQRIVFRIGINVGDIIIKGDDIFGDGVNVAARLQEIAAPGGICISNHVYDDVLGRTSAEFEDLGEQKLKNIDRLVQVWQWPIGVIAEPVKGRMPFFRFPTIAVLAFENMSGNTEQEYFADGLADDIITALSCWKLFPVISRSSSFAFKGQRVPISEISRQLGAQYIVEGSVRSSGNRVRVSAQLIDAESDHHLWTERYDRDLSDVFAVQEEIAFRVASAIEPAAIQSAAPKSLRRPSSPDAWGCALRGWWYLWKMNKLAAAEAEVWFQKAIDRDPLWSAGYTGLAGVGVYSLILGDQSFKIGTLAEIEKTANKAISLDSSDANAHLIVGTCASFRLDTDRALWSADRALALNPSLAMAHFCKGAAHIHGGKPEAGLLPIQNAIRLSPRDPFLPMWLFDLGKGHYLLGQHDQAIAECEKVLQMRPRWTAAMALTAASLSRLGQRQRAGDVFEKVKAIIPNFEINRLRASFHFLEPDFEMLTKDLRLAGWG